MGGSIGRKSRIAFRAIRRPLGKKGKAGLGDEEVAPWRIVRTLNKLNNCSYVFGGSRIFSELSTAFMWHG